MLDSFNHDFPALQPKISGPVPETVDTWGTNDGYVSGSDIEVLLQLWPGALVCCCLRGPPGFHTRVKAIGLKVTIGGNGQAID
jgi:hypothetical protein